MRLTAIGAVGLLTVAAATSTLGSAVPLGIGGGSGDHRAVVARWDGHVVEPGEEVAGLQEEARSSIETWRRFAERRGYRIDLDTTQRIMVVSDAERFAQFSTSAAIVERVLDELGPLVTPSAEPLVLLRAHSDEDIITATRAAAALGLSARLGAFVETGTLRDKRSVDARLAEGIVRTALAIDAPFLSEWMIDGLASSIAEDATGRAIVDGQAVTLRSVQNDVARAHRNDARGGIDLLAITGANGDGDSAPLEAEAMVLMTCTREHYEDELPPLLTELGDRRPSASTGKYRQEEEAFVQHFGLTALDDLQRALVEGRRFRRE